MVFTLPIVEAMFATEGEAARVATPATVPSIPPFFFVYSNIENITNAVQPGMILNPGKNSAMPQFHAYFG